MSLTVDPAHKSEKVTTASTQPVTTQKLELPHLSSSIESAAPQIGIFQCILETVCSWIQTLCSWISSLFAPAESPFFQVDCTYAGKKEGVDDLSYSDPKRGFGYILDGTGHGSVTMRTELEVIMSAFNRRFADQFPSVFNNLQEASEALKAQITELATAISTHQKTFLDDKSREVSFSDATYHPAFSFAAIVQIGKEKHWLTVQKADCSLVLIRADGEVDFKLANNPGGEGLGLMYNKVKLSVKNTPFILGDLMVGFSDGIGEFLTQKQCNAILAANKDRSQLLNEFKREIINIGKTKPIEAVDLVMEYFDEKAIEQRVGRVVTDDFLAMTSGGLEGVNGRNLKFHDMQKSNDDIGLFVLGHSLDAANK